MDFEPSYTPEQERFRDEVRRFLDATIDPARLPDTAVEALTPDQFAHTRELGMALGERGWLFPSYPPEYGGGGLSVDQAIVLEEEMHRRGLGLPPYYDSGGRLAGPTILVWGSDAQKRRFLPLIFRGLVSTWQLMSEPGAGSDVAAVACRAVRDGDSYVVNGQKMFVGSAYPAEWHFTLVNTDPAGPRHQNLSWLMIDAALPGISVQPLELLTANHGERLPIGAKNMVYFDDVRVPVDCLIGGENNAWRVNSTAMEVEHGGSGAIGRSPLADVMLAHVRHNLGALGGPDAVDDIADLYIEAETTRLFGLRNYYQAAADAPRSHEGSQLTMHHKVGGPRVARLVQDILGHQALVSDPAYALDKGRVEQHQRTSIVSLHPGGTVEVHKLIMARRIGIGRSDREQAGAIR